MRPLLLGATLTLAVAILFWARDLLIPISLAVLLTFLLSPVVGALQRHRVPRVLAVILVVVLAFSCLGALVWVVTNRASALGQELPRYESRIIDKVARLRQAGRGSLLERLGRVYTDVERELQRATPPPPATTGPAVPVIVRGEEHGPLSRLAALLSPLATAGLVIVLVIFMLAERQELRNRLIRLGGFGRVTITTKALDEAGFRISRYLLTQSVVNGAMGVLFGTALFLIGVPYAVLWAVVLAVMRFIPYVGVWLAVSAPIVLSVLLFDTWVRPVVVGVVFLALELTASSLVEPVVYSQQAGVSKVALLVAIAFWTWLWGPIGLVLATPLTVCLVVLAKYVPELEFVTVLMSDEPALPDDVGYYQRLLAGDQDEAADIVEEHVKTHPREEVYDAVLVPALVALQNDCVQRRLDDDDERFALRATREIVEDLGTFMAERRAVRDGPAADVPRAPVLGCPARGEVDEIGLMMLGQTLDPARFGLDMLPAALLSAEVVAEAERRGAGIVCIGAIPPGGGAQVRYLCKRLRARRPHVKIVVGRWGRRDAAGDQALLDAGADAVTGTILETRARLEALAPVAAAVESAGPAARSAA